MERWHPLCKIEKKQRRTLSVNACGIASSPEGESFLHLSAHKNKAPPFGNDFPRSGEDGVAKRGNYWRTK